jgi:hypothetical protein
MKTRIEKSRGLAASYRFSQWLQEYQVTSITEREALTELRSAYAEWIRDEMGEPYELLRMLDAWETPRKLPDPPKPMVHVPSWTPCKHYGVGTRECDACRHKRLSNARAKKVAEMYGHSHWGKERGDYCAVCKKVLNFEGKNRDRRHTGYHDFVARRVRMELMPFTNQGRNEADLQQLAWARIAEKIDQYVPQVRKNGKPASPMAWLQTVVHSTVLDYFKVANAAQRDERRTDMLNEAIYNPGFSAPKPKGATSRTILTATDISQQNLATESPT